MICKSIWQAGVAALLAAVAFVSAAGACPFCVENQGPTLAGDYKQAALVLLGRFENEQPGKGAFGGTTDFAVGSVFKDKEGYVKDKKVITLPRYLPPQKNDFLIFCDLFKGQVDPYRGVEVMADGDLVAYFKGAVTRADRPIGERLRYCFDYLNSDEFEVAIDAYREFQKAAYEDYRDMAGDLPAAKIAGWLTDPNTPAFRYGLYASLLGHCGKAKDAELLRGMIEDPKKRRSSGIDGMLAGYIMILDREGQTEKGLEFLRGLLDNPKEEFLMRYAVLRTIRFFWTTRPDVFTKEQMVDTVALTLKHSDMADFGIDDLRKWERWEKADEILSLFDKKGYDVPIIRRAILRFALQCPTEVARTFVARQEARDADWVNEVRELLELEVGNTEKTNPTGS